MLLGLYVTVFLFQIAESVRDGAMELILVQGIWRHGDRSPTKTFPTDPFQDGNWTFGGGGFGQLSPIGMKQHMNLGKLLRSTYVDSGFLAQRYSSKEIYIRSTDKNRTIISAMSNLLGMYSTNNAANIPGVDYPDEPGWPTGYVPVAIHTVDDDTDYIGNPDAVCPRQDKLWAMAKSSPELQAFQNRTDVVAMLNQLSKNCGEKVDIDNLWVVQDALMIEQLHANSTLRQVNKWFTDDLYNQMTVINDQVELYQNGIFITYSSPLIRSTWRNEKMNLSADSTLMMNGLNIGLELQKLRGGSMINDINMHMNLKIACMSAKADDPKCKWVNGNKYYIYSAHDTTIYAFFSILGIAEKVVKPRGYPLYSAATFVELWLNHTDNKPYFKLNYHANDVNVTIYPITTQLADCNGKTYCSLDAFAKFASMAKPDQPMDQWCNVDPTLNAGSTWTVFITAIIAISYALLRN
ncbi:hypothetical protein Y032_0551g3325 [Ancylostoma ceylanicum]|uniref:Histidine acid phosphatase n=1 Tax=Ancylostoma ceylanicum TaxID=53326 RepID=A0A016WRL6_9BILA|nr:hypothetical protein Y032_0551g3325 [Ancylostoma ceylanicum]